MSNKSEKTRVIMQIIISLALLFTGLAIITSPNPIIRQAADPVVRQMAAGWIGVVIGYWLS